MMDASVEEAGWASRVETRCWTVWKGRPTSFSRIALPPRICCDSNESIEWSRWSHKQHTSGIEVANVRIDEREERARRRQLATF